MDYTYIVVWKNEVLVERCIIMTHIVFLIAILFSLPVLNKKYPFFIFSFFTLFLFLALRYNYGNDYMSYYNIHAAMNEGREAWGENDILFKYLNLLISNFYLLISITSLFYLFTIYFLIKSNLRVKQYWLALLILLINPYLFLIHLSSIRQTIAICFVVFAFHFAKKRKLLKYLLFIIIAAGFHQSALILLPVYFLLNESKLNKKRIILTFGFIVILLITPLFEIILNKALEYFPSYYYYVEQDAQNSLRATLISSFFFFLIIFNINKLEGKEIIYGKLSLFATVISILSIKLSMLTRVGMYFDIFLIIGIPLILSRLKNKVSKQILFIIIIAIYLLKYFAFFENPLWSGGYGTYRTILDVPLNE